jgi:MFS family permease
MLIVFLNLAKAYATQPFVWTLGGIIGSAMGGFLAQPAHFYPHLFPADGLFGRYPYLLPNLVSVAVIALAILQGIFFLEETNPRHKCVSSSEVTVAGTDEDEDGDAVDELTPLRGPRASAVVRERPPFAEESLPLPVEHNADLRRSSFGTVHSIKLPDEVRVVRSEGDADIDTDTNGGGCSKSAPAGGERAFNFTVLMMTLALAIFSYHQMAFCTLLPTTLLDKSQPPVPGSHLDLRGGLGMTVHDVGVYLAVNGIMGLFIQGVVFPLFVDRVGVWRSFVSIILLYPTAYLLCPFLSALPPALVSPGVYSAMVLQSFYGIIVGPCALILLKNATPSPQMLGRVNGLAMAACCLARTISPPIAGIIYSAGGSAAAWLSCAGMALLGILQLFWVPRKHVVGHVEVEAALLRE